MEVILIRTLEGLDLVEHDWRRAHQADPAANRCTSWPWMRAWLEITPYEWFVLAAKTNCGEFVGFLPVARIAHTLFMAGTPLADYTGLVCDTAREREAVAAWTSWLKEMPDWSEFVWTNGMDPRAEAFLGSFGSLRFAVKRDLPSPCSRIRLPATWDQYLRETLGKSTSEDLRWQLRRLEKCGELRVTEADDTTLDHHLAALLDSWQARWQAPDFHRQGFDRIMRAMHAEGLLRLTAMWRGDQPVAALSGFKGNPGGTFTTCITTSDREERRIDAGKILFTLSIRSAIEEGMTCYDFTQGAETYKIRFGSQTAPSLHARICRKPAGISPARILRSIRRRTAGMLAARPG